MAADHDLSFAHHFADLTDPRIARSKLHELLDIVAIAMHIEGSLPLKGDGTVWIWREFGRPDLVPALVMGTPIP